MGRKDSTKTRVKPLFDFIGHDSEMLNKFFQLFCNSKTPELSHGTVREIRYGSNEKLIPPSKSLLIWMLQNFGELKAVDNYGVKVGTETYVKRKKLFSGDKNMLNEALDLIATKSTVDKSTWYIFEGYTHPDIYIETDDSIFIGEAKRTESDITTKTTWLKSRDQLIRHIDSLLDGTKNIYSFYLLDKDEYLKGVYPERMNLYQNFDYFKSNLRHRDESDIKRAMESFIGYIFWDDIAYCFGISFPDSVNDIKPMEKE